MSTPATTTKPRYSHLECRPGSFYREFFLRGVNLRPSRLVAWMEIEALTPEQAAADRTLPLEAIREAIDYVKTNSDLIAGDLQRERELLRDRGLLATGDV